ncbi:NAD(P)-dependent oxidoreductase [Microbacterium sp. NPDC086615]|jgi:3-hydroxyisobutyrate dehydrogenase|uniref:NAD(P)-dependent oxidoreductase n=1 Tax=Microbacterium sp. NPDC086615 TaxID=3154865 RepID=UPI003421DE8D|nr:3-hydroxyisobutyrate dehydrogenase [Microbacterium sp.]
MTQITFIGLGTMGAPMVARLVSAGHNVAVSDAAPDVAARVAAETGARVAADSDLGRSEVVVLMLPNSDIVASVLGTADDAESMASRLAPGALVVDMGSSRPDATRGHADDLATRGVTLIDAPVSGGPRRAATGELAIMVGVPDDAAWDRVRPLLGALGSSMTRTGPVGSAHAVKALNNLLSVIGIVGAIEVLSVGTKFGLDPRVMLDVINHSTGRNHATEVKIGPQVLDREWNVGFSLGLTVKDVTTAQRLAESVGVAIPVSDSAVEVARAALASFDGAAADQSQIAQYLESVNGVALGTTDKKDLL